MNHIALLGTLALLDDLELEAAKRRSVQDLAAVGRVRALVKKLLDGEK